MTILRVFAESNLDYELDLLEWIILDVSNTVIRSGRNAINDLPICTETEIVISGTDINFLSVKLPDGNHKKVLSAIPYLVEDFILSNPERVHVTLIEKQENIATLVVIDKEFLNQLLRKLEKHQIFPSWVYPENMLLPVINNAWTIAQHGQRLIVRTGQNSGFSIYENTMESSKLPWALKLALDKINDKPDKIIVYGDLISKASDWHTMLNIKNIETRVHDWRHHIRTSTINLLTGEFEPTHKLLKKMASYRSILIFVALIFAVQFIFMSIQYVYRLHLNHQLDNQMIEVFQSTFPQNSVIVNAPVQMQRKWEEAKLSNRGSSHGDFVPLLVATSQSIGSISVDKLLGMSYKDEKLILLLRLRNKDQAEKIRQQLISSGLVVAIDNVRNMGSLQEIQLLISAGVK